MELKYSRNQLAHPASILQNVRPAIPLIFILTDIRGCSAVSPNEKVLAMTNLYNGIDWYSLDSNHFMDTSFEHTTTHAISENVILPLTFIHNGTAVLSGTSTSCAWITSLKDHSLAELLQHDSEWQITRKFPMIPREPLNSRWHHTSFGSSRWNSHPEGYATLSF